MTCYYTEETMKNPTDLSLLVVNGDEDEADSAAGEFLSLGFGNVSVANSSQAARLMMKNRAVDAVIVDSRRAIALLEHRSEFPDTKFLVVGQHESIWTAFQARGADGFLLVPTDTEKMNSAILALFNADTS